MPEFQVGELVDITIRTARVVNTYPSHVNDEQVGQTLLVEYREGQHRNLAVNLDAPNVTVDRVAPAEWPPRAGDLWRDKHGVLWFTYQVPTGPSEFVMRTATGGRWSVGDEGQLDDNAPWTLVHREKSGDVDA